MPEPAPTRYIISNGLQRAKEYLSQRLLEWSQHHPESTETRYNVTFTGTFNGDESAAIANVAAFFKLGQENTRRLLQPGRTLKTYNDKSPADKLAQLLTRAGALCKVELEVPEQHGEPTRLQKAAFALDALQVPAISLPDPRHFERRQWLLVGACCLPLLLAGLYGVLKPPVISGETQAEYEASIARVTASVSAEKSASVQRAIALLTTSSAGTQQDIATADPEAAARQIHAPIEGKTADEILALAEARLVRQRSAYQEGLAAADRKIAEAEQQLADIAPSNVAVIDKLKVGDAAFGWPAAASGPTLVFSLTNNSSETLTRIFLQGYLYDANGTLLTSNPVTYALAGGMAPGATAQIALPARSDSPWAKTEWRGRTGLQLQVRVANAENRQGATLGTDYRPIEAERQRQLDWKRKVQKELDAMKL